MENRSNISLVGNTTQGNNLGSGCAIFASKSGGNILDFKTLSVTGTSIQLFSDDNTIYISGSSSGSGGTSYTFSNGITESGGVVKLGGTLTQNTCINGGGSNYGLTFSGSSYYSIDISPIAGSYINLLTQGQVNLEGCNVCAVLGGASFDIFDYLGNPAIELSTGNDVRFCCLAAKTTETDVLYINSNTGQLVTGATTTSVGGSDGNIQYNNGGSAFGGTCLNWDDSLNHIGWNKTATSDTMFVIKKDVTYANKRDILEFFSCDSFEIEDLSMVKVEVCGYDTGGGIHLQNICGYNSGTVSNLCLCGNNNVYVYATDYVAIHSILRLNPTSAPGTPLEGMVYYDNTANKLKFYNGTAWETVTSSI